MNFLDPRLPDRFWSKVTPEPNSGCWLWLSDSKRYGYIKIGHRSMVAHRATWVTEFGDVPPGLELDHKVCQTTLCCNPHHLEAVTHQVNVSRGRLAIANSQRHRNRTHCLRGHEYEKHGSIRNGKRQCRVCINDLQNARSVAKRLAAGHRPRSRKLCLADAIEIKRRLAAGEGPSSIARSFGTSDTLISNIKSGQAWAHARSA